MKKQKKNDENKTKFDYTAENIVAGRIHSVTWDNNWVDCET